MSSKKKKIKKLKEKNKVLKNEIIQLEEKNKDLLIKLAIHESDNIKEIWPNVPFNYQIGEWKCENSPVELCVYNMEEDPCLDECIFCGNPDERK